jgi:hypothetical protein
MIILLTHCPASQTRNENCSSCEREREILPTYLGTWANLGPANKDIPRELLAKETSKDETDQTVVYDGKNNKKHWQNLTGEFEYRFVDDFASGQFVTCGWALDWSLRPGPGA